MRDFIENPQNSIITSPVTLAEVVSKFIRTRRDPKTAVEAIESNSTIPALVPGLARLAGELHAEQRKRQPDFGLADAFVLATARSRSGRVLTGDPHFKTIPEAMMI